MKNVFTVLILAAASLSAAAQNCPVGIVSGQDSVRGMQFGVVASVAGAKARGVQLSGFSNMTTGSLRGVQLSGVSNIAAGVEKGVQLSSMLNVSSGYMRGLQAAFYNYADSLNGTQIGIFNVARTHPKGWQIGLLNISHDTIAHKLTPVRDKKSQIKVGNLAIYLYLYS